jgi:DNA ligase 4
MEGANSMKFYSLLKVGGGFTAQDYSTIRHHTEGKWIDWDPKRPPTEFIELGGGDLQYERPDVWIRPTDSVVVSVKAASVTVTDQFRMGCTVRFPRFKRLRLDRDWSTALSIREFTELKDRVEEEIKDKKFQVDTGGKRAKRSKREIVIAGNDQVTKAPYAEPTTQIFEGLNFCIMTESLKPLKRMKGELEQLVKANGAKIFQSPAAVENMICIAEKRVVKVASLIKSGRTNVVKPAWLFDALMQSEADLWKPRFLLPFEKKHMFYVIPEDEAHVNQNTDPFEDSYTRDVDVSELRDLFEGIRGSSCKESDSEEFPMELGRYEQDFREMKGWLFRNLRIHLDFKSANDVRKTLTGILLRFAGAEIAEALADDGTTHILVDVGSPNLGIIRQQISRWVRLPRIVTIQWVDDCWNEGSLLDEERYSPVGL